MLRLSAVVAARGRGRSSTYNDISAGLLTRPVQIGERGVAWPDYEIAALNRAAIAGANAGEIRALVEKLHAQRNRLALPVEEAK